jgi:hypothetical protein
MEFDAMPLRHIFVIDSQRGVSIHQSRIVDK